MLGRISFALMPLVIAGTGLAVRQRRRSRRSDASAGVQGVYVTSWGELREAVARHAPDLLHEGARTYMDALEAICEGGLDFGYAGLQEGHARAVVICNDRFFGFEALPKGKVTGYSGYLTQLTHLKLTRSRGGLKLEVGYDPGPGWTWEAREGQEALSQFATELGDRKEAALGQYGAK